MNTPKLSIIVIIIFMITLSCNNEKKIEQEKKRIISNYMSERLVLHKEYEKYFNKSIKIEYIKNDNKDIYFDITNNTQNNIIKLHFFVNIYNAYGELIHGWKKLEFIPEGKGAIILMFSENDPNYVIKPRQTKRISWNMDNIRNKFRYDNFGIPKNNNANLNDYSKHMKIKVFLLNFKLYSSNGNVKTYTNEGFLADRSLMYSYKNGVYYTSNNNIDELKIDIKRKKEITSVFVSTIKNDLL